MYLQEVASLSVYVSFCVQVERSHSAGIELPYETQSISGQVTLHHDSYYAPLVLCYSMTGSPSRWPVLSGLDTTSLTATASLLLRRSGAGNHPIVGTQATLDLVDCSERRAVSFRSCEQYLVSLGRARDMKDMVSFSCSTVLST